MFDIIIRGGTIIDGTKAARFRGDLGIQGDRITQIGDLSQTETRVSIDAVGKIVAPGFVDVHNHSDGWMLKRPHLLSKTIQGFTTEVLMLDGISYAPVNEQTARQWLFYLRPLDGLQMDEYRGWQSIAEFMDCIDGNNVQNAIAHVPYANVRSLVCGFGRGSVDDFQMGQIKAEISKGMQEGAVGISTGLDYIAQCFSTTDELVEAASAMAEYNGLYVTHVRYKSGRIRAIQEAVDIGRRAGVRVHISHLQEEGQRAVDELLNYIDNVARQQVDLSFDVYPYRPGSTMLSYLLPYEVWDDGPLAALSKLHDTGIRTRFRESLKAYPCDLDKMTIAWVASKDNSRHQGKLLSQYVAETGVPAEEALLDLLIEERLAVLLVFDKGDDKFVQPFLQHDLYMLGTDGIFFDDAAVHPRQFGSSGRLLGRCVRDWKLFSLEEAVYKLSGYAADRFGLENRSILREGNFADLVIFDPETIIDPATLQNPQQHTVGIEHVLVNGVPIIRDGTAIESTEQRLPGRSLKHQRGEP